jgi:hypothetical protein
MTDRIQIHIPGPFTLRVSLSVTKDGREDVGNLLSNESQEYTRKFDTLPEALQWFKDHLVIGDWL